MILHLICDTSGSMNEGGKPFIMRTVVQTLTQWARLGYGYAEISLSAWSSELRHFPDWSVRDEFPAELLSCSGVSSGEALIKWIGDKLEGKVILITDGFWARDEEQSLKRWRESLPADSLRFIKIGADANPHLKGPDVFETEDVFAVLDGWVEGGAA